jgi:beta-lactamase class A
MLSTEKAPVATVVALSLLALVSGCEDDSSWNGSLEALMRSQPQRFAAVMADPAKYRVQVIYTQIDRDAENRPKFRSYTYRLNADEYFYPASTVKLPVALLALEKVNRLNVTGLDRNAPMLIGAGGHGQTSVTEDPTAPGGLPSIAHYIRKVLLVSDNDAFNRLYEFVGQAEINESLRAKGRADTRILHRLDLVLDVESNRYTNPVRFVDGTTTLWSQDGAYSPRAFVAPEPLMLGRAEVVDGVRMNRPKNFAEKNAFPLQDLHDVLKALLFPTSVAPEERFGLTEDDYRFVYRQMSRYPQESGIEEYSSPEEYPQAFVKYLMYDRDETIPANIRIFNKIGSAYGFLTDAAYIVDYEQGIEFILAATVYTNANEVFNDGDYEYEEIGFPFMRDLGRAVYEIEVRRKKPNVPDLRRFQLDR